MEKNNLKRWRKTLRSLRRYYHSVNNIRMKAKDSEFKEFSLLEYTKVLQEEIKDPKRLEYLKRLELAKKGYLDKDFKMLLVAAKQKERFISHDHKTIPIGNIQIMEGEKLIAMVQLGFDSSTDSFCTSYRNHGNIPLWKPYGRIKLDEYLAALHPETDSKLKFTHVFFDTHAFKVKDETKKGIQGFYNNAILRSFQSNTYFKNSISPPKEDLILNPNDYLGKQFYLSLSKDNETIMTLTEATDRYFVFQSFMETAPKPESIYFERREFKERFLDSGITLLARLKHNLQLGVQNGMLHIGKLDEVNGKTHLRWQNFESRIHSGSLSAKEKYYLSKEVISKKNFLVETDAISLKSNTKEASLKKHYGTNQWYFAEGKNNQEELNFRPVDDNVLRHINETYSQSKYFRMAVTQLQKHQGVQTVQMKPS